MAASMARYNERRQQEHVRYINDRAMLAAGICPSCQRPLKGHPRCQLCRIMVGPGHLTPYTHKGACGSCLTSLMKHSGERW